MNTKLKNVSIGLLMGAFCVGSFSWIYTVATGINYKSHVDIELSVVDHPEFIPTAPTVRIGSSGMENLVADFYWLRAIQYIGGNAISAEYKAYLAVMLELVTDLSPHFTYPYQIGMLLLPDVNLRYEQLSTNEQQKHIVEALQLGKKGITKNCDMKRIEEIGKFYNLDELLSKQDLKEPCTDAMIPYYLAYVSYWNNNDPKEASLWYRVTSMHEAAPRGARIMSAIMQGKTGNREKAIIMFLSLAEEMSPDEKSLCHVATNELKNLLVPAFEKGAKLTPDFLRQVEQVRAATKKSLGEKQEEIEKTDISSYCSSYFDKSVREMNLAFIQEADARYFADNKKHARNAKELLEKGYITYLPHDYQKGNGDYEVIYVYNEKTQGWDFEMGEY